MKRKQSNSQTTKTTALRNLETSKPRNRARGFTLIELIITMAIIIVLAFGVVFILDPFELIDRARDSQRVQDLRSLEAAIKIARQEGGGNFDPDGAEENSCVGESAQKVFVSIPLGVDMPIDLPSGWSYKRVSATNLFNTNGTGWLPIDLSGAMGASAQLSHLPIDPTNTFPSEYYYSYVCDRSGFNFELTTRLASKKHRTGGVDDAQTDDGGDEVYVFETGTDLTLDPKAPTSAWYLDGSGSGAISDGETAGFEDVVGSHDGTFTTDGGATWVSGVLGNALSVDEGDFSVVLDHSDFSPPRLTVTAWFSPTGTGSKGYVFGKRIDLNNQEIQFGLDNTNDQLRCGMANSGAREISENTAISVSTDDWHFGACTFSDTAAELVSYLDGVVMEIEPTVATIPDTTANVLIGNDQPAASGFQGRIDLVQFYDRPLTTAELQYQYESLKP